MMQGLAARSASLRAVQEALSKEPSSPTYHDLDMPVAGERWPEKLDYDLPGGLSAQHHDTAGLPFAGSLAEAMRKLDRDEEHSMARKQHGEDEGIVLKEVKPARYDEYGQKE